MTLPAVSLAAPADAERSRVAILSFRRYCAIWIIGVVALIALVGAFDALVDPFLVIGAPRIAGLNAAKPETITHTQLAKDYMIGRVKPAGVVLGNSKVDMGIDPKSRFWPDNARPVFNYGVPGIGVRDVLTILRRAIASGNVRRALVVLDVEDFMGPAEVETATPVASAPLQHLRDILLATLSLDAFRASIATVIAQQQSYPIDLSPDGATNDQGFRNEVKTDGYEGLFLQKDAWNAGDLARFASALRAHPNAKLANLDQVAEIIAVCRQHGIALDFTLPPMHADLLVQIDRAGLWPRYQRVKAELTRLIAADSGGTVRFWDFDGFDAFSTEPVPMRIERHTDMRWFWEPNHFKRALGNKMLAAIYDDAPGYGVQLTPEMITAHLAAETAARDAWEAGDTGEWRGRLEARATMR